MQRAAAGASNAGVEKSSGDDGGVKSSGAGSSKLRCDKRLSKRSPIRTFRQSVLTERSMSTSYTQTGRSLHAETRSGSSIYMKNKSKLFLNNTPTLLKQAQELYKAREMRVW